MIYDKKMIEQYISYLATNFIKEKTSNKSQSRHINTLKFFGPIWAKGKLAQLYFYEKEERVQLSFGQYYF